MKKRSLFVLIPFYLLTTTSLFPQQQRENAALFLPRSMSGLQGDEAQILISTLEEELSTRFNLIARSAVNRAFKQAVSSLPQEQCTEENCLLRMQEILEVNLIFTFGVLKSDMTTLLTLQLQEGPQKVVKNEICNSPCNTPILISGVKDLVQRLLSERDKNRSPQSYGDPGISLFEQEIQVEEGGLMGTLNLSLKAPPFGEVIISYEEMPMGFLEIDPKEIVFNESNWDQEQSFQIYALNNDRMDGDRDAGLIFKVKETKDMNYSFAPPVEARVKIKDDDTDGEMRLLTIPSGASVFVDGEPLLDIDKKPVLSPHNLRLKRGKRVIRIKREGHNEETFSVNVTKKRMGTRVVNLTPLVASLRLRVPDRYSFSDLFIDGEKRLSFKGRTSIQSKLPPGVYTLHVVSDNAESESRTMNLKGGQSTEVYFQRFTQRERLFDRGFKLIGMEESYAGPHADMLVSQSAGFPLKYVGWSLPGLAWGLRSDRQALEIQAAQGSGVTDTFTASESGSDYYIKNVSVQRLGLSYGYRMFRPVQLNLGLSTTTLNFSSSARSFEYIYPAAFAGLGWDTKIGAFRVDASGRYNTLGQSALSAGMRFLF